MTAPGHRPRLRLVGGAPAPHGSPGASGEDALSGGPAPAPSPPDGGEPEGDAGAPLHRVAAARPADELPPRLEAAGPVSGRAPSSRAARASMLAALPDAQLVALGLEGDTPALEALYVRHAAFAINLATRIEGSTRDIEDIVHDAFIKAFGRLGELTDRAAFRAWLGAIVVHAVRSRMRRTRLMSLLGLGRTAEPVDLDALATPDASPHVRAQIAQIYALLRTLPTDERIAWTLRTIEGHDLEAVARLSSCSLATAKRRISRAQRFLDEHFVDPQQHATKAGT